MLIRLAVFRVDVIKKKALWGSKVEWATTGAAHAKKAAARAKAPDRTPRRSCRIARRDESMLMNAEDTLAPMEVGGATPAGARDVEMSTEDEDASLASGYVHRARPVKEQSKCVEAS